MRFVKLGLISFVFFSLLLTGISLLLPSQTNILRAIDIAAPADLVYASIKDLKNWKYWYADYDSAKTEISATTGGKTVLIVNNTKITIEKVLPGKIQAQWQTGKSNPLEGEFSLIKNSGTSVTLQWNFVQKVKWYPWQKFASIVSNKVIGFFMEKSLDNLKKHAEQQ